MPDVETGGIVKPSVLPFLFFALFGIALAGVIVYPHLDVIVSGWFYKAGQGFYMENEPMFVVLHRTAIQGAWYLFWFFAAMMLLAFCLHKEILRLPSKAWLFLLLALMIGPGLIANAVLKDNWGRARPREVTEFGGALTFSPAIIPQPEAGRNESFVAGDGAFGAYLHSFTYMIPLNTQRRRSRYAFWGLVGIGGLFGYSRIAMGAHFFSDVLFATLFMLISSGVIHAICFGQESTRNYWRAWLGLEPKA